MTLPIHSAEEEEEEDNEGSTQRKSEYSPPGRSNQSLVAGRTWFVF